MSKHTPGPWVVVFDNDSKAGGYPSRISAIEKSPFRRGGICDITRRNAISFPASAEGYANAHLIAAAPDLLAALRQARLFVYAELEVRAASFTRPDPISGRPDWSTLDESDGGACGEAQDLLGRIDAVIAKAESPVVSAVAKLLKRARERIQNPRRWTQGALARDACGSQVMPEDASAVCWCAVGALAAERPDVDAHRSAVALLTGAAGVIRWGALAATINDTRTHAVVLAMFDAAIAKAEAAA